MSKQTELKNAFLILFQLDSRGLMGDDPKLDEKIEVIISNNIDNIDQGKLLIDSNAREIIFGVANNQIDIDLKLEEIIDNWEITNLDAVDRTLLRIAVYQIFIMQEPLLSVQKLLQKLINTYATDKSIKFINSIVPKISTQ